jgi:hypothetical protein
VEEHISSISTLSNSVAIWLLIIDVAMEHVKLVNRCAQLTIGMVG